jgi:hypothetical protein
MENKIKIIKLGALTTKKNYASRKKIGLQQITKLLKSGKIKSRKIEEFDLELIYDKSDTSKIIKLSLKFTTPKNYAKELNISRQVIYNWIKRDLITHKHYPKLNNLTLVERGSERLKKIIKKNE